MASDKRDAEPSDRDRRRFGTGMAPEPYVRVARDAISMVKADLIAGTMEAATLEGPVARKAVEVWSRV